MSTDEELKRVDQFLSEALSLLQRYRDYGPGKGLSKDIDAFLGKMDVEKGMKDEEITQVEKRAFREAVQFLDKKPVPAQSEEGAVVRGIFKAGEEVELIEDVEDISWAQPIPAGVRGTLGTMYRVQEGLEIWPLWLHESIEGKCLAGVNHRQIKKL